MKATTVHYRTIQGIGKEPNTTACSIFGFNSLDTDIVTCPLCLSIAAVIAQHQLHCELVQAQLYPKFGVPLCLKYHRPSSTSNPLPSPAEQRAPSGEP